MSTDRPTEVLAAWDEVTRSAQAPHQPASLRSRVEFPSGALVLGAIVLALVLVLPLLQATSPGGGGALSSGSPTVVQTDPSATDGPTSAPIVTCSGVSAEGCTAAVALVRQTYPDEFARTFRVVVADSCPPTMVCDRAFPFDAYVVLIAPDGAQVRAVQVVGRNGPERIFGPAPSPLPPHVEALVATGPPVPSIQPAPALITDRVGRLAITHPASWRYVAGPPPVEGAYVPLFYLTNVAFDVSPCPTRDPATHVFHGCPVPVDHLPEGGVLVTVSPNGGLPMMEPPQVTVVDARDRCLAIRGDRQVNAVVGGVVVGACVRGPDVGTAVEEVQNAIASITGAW
jgi:hypothetical protein